MPARAPVQTVEEVPPHDDKVRVKVDYLTELWDYARGENGLLAVVPRAGLRIRRWTSRRFEAIAGAKAAVWGAQVVCVDEEAVTRAVDHAAVMSNLVGVPWYPESKRGHRQPGGRLGFHMT